MTEPLSTKYNPAEFEAPLYKEWEAKGYFRARAERVADGREPYTIVIPPPNVTAVLHMGHGLNNTLQDVLTRWRRMQGYEALYLPGTDHAGIATQNVVERMIAKEGKSRDDLGREKFVERVWSLDPPRRDDHADLKMKALQPNRDDVLSEVEEMEGNGVEIGISRAGPFTTDVPPGKPVN